MTELRSPTTGNTVARRPAARRAAAAAVASLLAVVIAGCGGGGGESAHATHAAFGYGQQDGPAHWSALDPSYQECAKGRRQSPIDLTGARPSALPRITFSYQPAKELEIENNGHSLEAKYPPGSSIEVGGTKYELKQFHFHAPSEHRVSGASSPIEFHLVHESKQGKRLVLGVFGVKGRPNHAVSQLVKAMPPHDGETRTVPGEVDALDLLPPHPGNAKRWTYSGSLTTPPCTEGVRWYVFADPIELSAGQLDAYTSIYEGNNRPVQPLNGRTLGVGR